MGKTRKKVYMMLALLTGMIFSWLFLDWMTSYKPEHVVWVLSRNQVIYGIDLWQQNYVIFSADAETKESSRISIPRIKNGKICTLADFTVTESGKAYVTCTLGYGKDSVQSIYYCDFEKGRLEYIIPVEFPDNSQLFAMTNAGDTLQLLSRGSEGELKLYVLQGKELVLSKSFPPVKEEALLIGVVESNVVIIGPDGQIYILDEAGELHCVFTGNQPGGDSWYTEFQYEKDAIYCVDSATKLSYRLDLSDKNLDLELCNRPVWEAKTFDSSRMSSIGYDGDKGKYGILTTEDGRQQAAMCGTWEYVVEELEWGLKARLAVWGLCWGILAVAAVLGNSAWKALIKRQKVIPLALEAAILMAVLLIPGIQFLEEQVMLSIQENAIENDTEAGIQRGYEWMEQTDFQKMDKNSLTEYSLQYDLYEKKEGEIYPLNSIRYVKNVPLRYNYINANPLVIEAAEKVLETNTLQIIEYMDLIGQKSSVFLPVPKEKGEYPMVLEVQIPIEQSNKTLAGMALSFHKLLYLISGVLLVTLLLSIWYFMRPIGKLKQAALEVIKGNLGLQTNVKGRSEAAITARQFNHMSEQLGMQVSGIQNYRKKYEAFLPLLLWENALDKKKRGNSECPAMLVTMTVGNEDRSGDLKFITEEIRRHGGEVLSFEREALTCLFLEHAGEALMAAISILQNDQSTRGLAIGFEKIFLGVIGNESRSAITAYSSNGDFSGYLRRMAEELRTPLLITRSALEQIEGFFKEYHVRYVGKCFNKITSQTEQLYEVLDGESGENRRKKELTKEVFEKGLTAFEQGEDLLARSCFLTAYLENKTDLAALYYIRICDENLSFGMEDTKRFLGEY